MEEILKQNKSKSDIEFEKLQPGFIKKSKKEKQKIKNRLSAARHREKVKNHIKTNMFHFLCM